MLLVATCIRSVGTEVNGWYLAFIDVEPSTEVKMNSLSLDPQASSNHSTWLAMMLACKLPLPCFVSTPVVG